MSRRVTFVVGVLALIVALIIFNIVHLAFEEFGQITQMIGFSCLAVTFISVRKHGKKKVKN